MKTFEVFTSGNGRLYIFYVLFPLMAFILIASLAHKQFAMYENYKLKSDRQTLRRIVSPGARGDICDRNGKILVSNAAKFAVIVYYNGARRDFNEERKRLRKELIDNHKASGSAEKLRIDYTDLLFKARKNVLEGYIKQVNEILKTDYKLDKGDFMRHFSQLSLLPFPIIRNLSPREHAILAERLSVDSPIQIFSDTERYYPYGEYLAHVLGYVKQNYEDLDSDIPGEELMTFFYQGKSGVSGIEKAFDSSLSGKSGIDILVVDPVGFEYDNLLSVPPQKGKTIVSSIDIDLQKVAEEAIAEAEGAVVMLDVKTGEVLVMASKPGYNPNLLTPRISREVYAEIVERKAWTNRATQGLYSPGSTFKIMTAIAGLMTGVVDENTHIECHGSMKVGNRIFLCNAKYGHGKVNLESAIAKSCNIFFYQTGLDAGVNAVSETAKEFGLDSSPNIELPENSWRNTIVPNPAFKKKLMEGPWTLGDTANMSIGQGYDRQTPLQIACMAASLARGETRTKASILHDPMRITDMEYHGAEKIDLPKEKFDLILKGMVGAVEYGTCKKAKLDSATSAAKSGTAQVTIDGNKTNLAWMISFAPAEDPKVAIAVMTVGQHVGDVSGGGTAGPIVKAVFEKYFEKLKE